MPTARMRRAGPLETLFRVNEVQAYGITALRSGAIDVMITPDTSAFEFADFHRADELAEVGEAAAEAMLPQLTQIMAQFAHENVSPQNRGDAEHRPREIESSMESPPRLNSQ